MNALAKIPEKQYKGCVCQPLKFIVLQEWLFSSQWESQGHENSFDPS
jgi:hypothetical protein